MTTFYNEWEPKTAAWLRELARQGHVTNGVVDERSIKDIQPDELCGYRRAHFFAGIGGWDYALRLAGWPDDRPVWTGSCPCQPFSSAGKRQGQADERHLWPDWFRLIRKCRPDTIFGEQVASAIGHGWLDGVFADLEGIGYTCGAVVLGAHSVGAPHIRQRVWWVAESQVSGGRGFCGHLEEEKGSARRTFVGRADGDVVAGSGSIGGLGIARRDGSQGECQAGATCGTVERACVVGGVEHYQVNRLQEHDQVGSVVGVRCGDGAWSNTINIPCGDGKTRRLEPGISPLVDGVPGRMVIVCSNCKTETTINENLHYMRSFNRRDEGCSSSQVLLDGVSEQGDVCSNSEGRARAGKATNQGRGLQQVRSNQETPQAPQRQKSTEQLAWQHRNPLHEVSRSGTLTGTEAVDMRRVWDAIRGKGPQIQSQDLLCRLCKVVGPHMCQEKVGGSRITELRGYGNAIVPQVAAAFVRAFMEAA